MNEIPEVRNLPLALLIGNNCPKALEPMQVIQSQGEGPYAKRTRLGWCVIGTGATRYPAGTKCNVIKVCTSVKDITNGCATRAHIVLQSKISNAAISHALQEMWRKDFIELDSERKAVSKEDKNFLEMMKDSVKFTDGHYELPLPLHVEEVPVAQRNATGQTKLPILTPEEVTDRLRSAAEIEGVNQTGKMSNEKEATTTEPQGSSSIPMSSQGRSGNEILNEDERSGLKQRVEKSLVTKERVVVMPDNRGYALQRMKSVKRKMLREKGFAEEYAAFMSKLFTAGYAQVVPEGRSKERGWFLPHHGVYHPTKKKIRVVFDCSAEKDDVSLNSKLMQGPDFSNSMIGVLLRFRKGCIPFTADIESMYHQVRVPVEHRKYLRFFWWKNDDCRKDLVECEMCVHPFG